MRKGREERRVQLRAEWSDSMSETSIAEATMGRKAMVGFGGGLFLRVTSIGAAPVLQAIGKALGVMIA